MVSLSLLAMRRDRLETRLLIYQDNFLGLGLSTLLDRFGFP